MLSTLKIQGAAKLVGLSAVHNELNPQQRLSARVRIALAIGAVAVLALAATISVLKFERWRTHPQAFGTVGDLDFGRVDLGQTIYAGESAWPTPSPYDVRLTRASAVLTLNTADAGVKILVCTIRPSARIGTIGLVTDARRYCSSLVAFAPGTYALKQGHEDILVAVTPHRPGRVDEAGVELSYSEGIRRGQQDTGINLHTRTPPR